MKKSQNTANSSLSSAPSLTTNQPLATVLTIAGSDCSGGAGLQADLKTIHALGAYALTVPTAITAQNSRGVSAVYPLEAKVIEAQLEALLADYQIDAIKIGMLGNLAVLKTVINILKKAPAKHIILDTVLISSSGKPLLEEQALPIFINELLPLASVITPNLPELNTLLKDKIDQPFIGQKSEMEEIAQQLAELKVKTAVVKGGHTIEAEATDYLIITPQRLGDKAEVQAFSTPRLDSVHSHGTGCTYASAIATELAKGRVIQEAVLNAKNYLFSSLQSSQLAQPHYLDITTEQAAKRKGGLNHFHALF